MSLIEFMKNEEKESEITLLLNNNEYTLSWGYDYELELEDSGNNKDSLIEDIRNEIAFLEEKKAKLEELLTQLNYKGSAFQESLENSRAFHNSKVNLEQVLGNLEDFLELGLKELHDQILEL